jgi:hypothetical protein
LQPYGQSSQTIQVWDPVYFEAINSPHYNKSTIDVNAWSRNFSFDQCLWPSPDDFDGSDNDNLNNEFVHRSNQDKVFKEIGQPVLDWILDGYNCCVLAYGQTGAGNIISHYYEILDNFF